MLVGLCVEVDPGEEPGKGPLPFGRQFRVACDLQQLFNLHTHVCVVNTWEQFNQRILKMLHSIGYNIQKQGY